MFDALFPFLILFLISFVTKPVPKHGLDRFFAKLHTPVQRTPEEEKSALEDSYRYPEKFEKDKLLPDSQWEIMKPGKMDILGFGGSWIIVEIIILILWVMVSIK
jgi:SSS family solute:Na+ symporter